MKRVGIAVVVAGVVFAAAYGFAASLNLTSDTLGAGSSVVAACQSGTVNVSYTPAYSSSQPGYQATTVTLNGLDETAPACGGKAVRITLADNSQNSLGEQTGTIPTGSGTTYAVTFTGVAAASVYNVHVVVTG